MIRHVVQWGCCWSFVCACCLHFKIWGGGIYETETFYRTASELGLVILQDGSFFGSYPGPEDTGFTELVRREIEYQARRLSPHVALCLYSGNNECVWLWCWFIVRHMSTASM